MAQLGARFHGMEEVIGSIPIRSTNNPIKNKHFPPSSLFEGRGEIDVLPAARFLRLRGDLAYSSY